MSFLASLVLLAAVVIAVLVPMFVGHGLAVHSTGPILLGIGAGVLAGALIALVAAWRGALGESREH